MPKPQLAKISIVVGTIATAVPSVANIQITFRYLSSTGKTRALFGIVDAVSYSWIYWLVIPTVSSLILAILAFIYKEGETITFTALLVGLVSVSLVFVRFWWFLT
jgi:hypothetical protein